MSADAWLSTTLGKVAEFGNGGAWSQDEYAGDGIRVVRVSDVKGDTLDLSECKYLSMAALDRYRRHQLRKGDLIICTVGSHPTQPASVVGRAVVVPKFADGALLNQNAVRVRPAVPHVHAAWLGFLGRSRRFHEYIIGCAGGAASQVRMPIGLLKEMPIAVPPLSIQRRIASILSAYDDLIENNSRRIAILEEMARRIYEEWFVRFRFPGHEGVRMVESESELGLVPNGWAVRAFDDIATFTNGFAFKPEHLGTEGCPIVKIKELKAGVQADTPRFNGSLPDRYRIKHGDLLFSWSADLDVYIWGDEDGWLNQHLFLVDALGPETPSSYLFHALKTAMPSFRTRSNGATMKHIKRSALSEVKTAVPPSQVAEAFDQAVGPLHELVKVLSRKNLNLRSTRDLLLPKLISGELDVSAMPEPEALAA